MAKSEAERAKEDLAWWKEAFGEYVRGWTYRNTALIVMPGTTFTATAKTREFFMHLNGIPKVDEMSRILDNFGKN
jgi:hypothetical protein